MGSLTARGRILVVLAFVVSASLFAGAAVAFVMARNDDDKKGSTALPSSRPTLVFPSEQPTAEPSESASPTAVPTTPAPTATVTASPTPGASASPSATSSPTPRRTVTAQPSPTGTLIAGLSTSSSINIAQGGTTADTFVVKIHATDADGSISLKSVSWSAGTTSSTVPGTVCSPAPKAPADCRNFTLSHKYAKAGSYLITIEVVSGKENAIVQYQIDVAAAPSPSPSAS